MALVGCGRIGFDPVGDGDSGGLGRWALIQTSGSRSSSVGVKPLGAHHLVVVAVQLFSDGLVTAIIDSSACNAYIAIPAAHAIDRTLGDSLQIFYAKDSCPEADAISIAATTAVAATVVWEVSGIRTDDPLDTAAVRNDQPASTAPLGPAITTSTPGEFVVSAAIVENLAASIHAGNEFTNDQMTNGNGWAHLTAPMAAAGDYQAQWDQPRAGAYCAAVAAFRVAP
jgi:hypothetical protein